MHLFLNTKQHDDNVISCSFSMDKYTTPTSTHSSAKENIWSYSKVKPGISSMYLAHQKAENMTRPARGVVAANQTAFIRTTGLE